MLYFFKGNLKMACEAQIFGGYVEAFSRRRGGLGRPCTASAQPAVRSSPHPVGRWPQQWCHCRQQQVGAVGREYDIQVLPATQDAKALGIALGHAQRQGVKVVE